MKTLMKTLLLWGILCSPAIAQDNETEGGKDGFAYWASKPIQCSDSGKLIGMMTQFGETPYIVMEGHTGLPNGSQSPSKFVLAVNPKSQTWTLTEFVGEDDEQACILGAGKGNITVNKVGGYGTKTTF